LKINSTRNRLLATSFIVGAAFVPMAATVVASLALMATPASAQDLTSGILQGRVVSDSGAPIASAKVVITSNNRGDTREIATDAGGMFRLNQAAIGTYSVAVTASGYKGFSDKSVSVSLGAVSKYEFTLASVASGDVAEIVITGKARQPSVDFDKVTTGITVDVQKTLEQLPVSRNINSIVALAPQTSINSVFGQPSISGSSSAENIYYINGMNITNFRNFLGGSTVPFEFYDQVEVKTGAYSAEFGRSTGGAVIAVSRSGSNEFHGGIDGSLEPKSLRSKAQAKATSSTLDAGVYTNNYTVPMNDKDQAYEGNLWLSGPIIKDRVFFFGFYNVRHFENNYGSASSDSSKPNQFTLTKPDVYDLYTRADPFFGGKIDVNITDSQRLELTYFKDNQSEQDQNFVSNGKGGYDVSHSNNLSGGENKIVKYTGRWTPWFTLSALYGESAYNQTSKGELDSQAAVLENGQLVRGNPALLIASGADGRKNSRVDADFYGQLFGAHHIRLGYDKEDLTSSQAQSYSGGTYYRYYPTGTNCGSTGFRSTAAEGCVRVRKLNNIGSFSIVQQAIYLQDAWDVNDRLSIQAGVRTEDFNNKNAAGKSFIHAKNQFAVRLGAGYDLFGDKTTKITAFYGRYYLPVAANTNIRGSGGEIFLQDYFKYSSRDATSLIPVLGARLRHDCLEGLDDGKNCNPEYPDPAALASQNLDPQYQDEFMVGAQRKLESGWTVGANLIYRELKSVLEDANLNTWLPDGVRNSYCVYAKISAANCGSFGNSGYVIINPGKSVQLKLDNSWGGGLAGTTVNIPSSVIGEPKGKRDYLALELTAKRPWDGKWSLDGSYVLSRSRGNYEGGVRSDTGQADTGGTIDFDEPGYMDGSSGLLPNDHRHQFKLYGAYQVLEDLKIGANASITSPSHYGCYGYYPLLDNRAESTTASAWYCNAQSPTPLAAGKGYLTPRGSQFKGDWIKKIDLSAVYTVPGDIFGSLQLRADVFNLLNSKGASNFSQQGETGGVGTKNYAYRTPSAYQTPRYVRVGFNYKF